MARKVKPNFSVTVQFMDCGLPCQGGIRNWYCSADDYNATLIMDKRATKAEVHKALRFIVRHAFETFYNDVNYVKR
jgi:hypothetical protein